MRKYGRICDCYNETQTRSPAFSIQDNEQIMFLVAPTDTKLMPILVTCCIHLVLQNLTKYHTQYRKYMKILIYAPK